MTELLTSAQMRAIEAEAIASGEVTGFDLMERAGKGVVEAIFEEWPEFRKAPFRAVVLCGPGNNGGDGFVVARLLKEWGADVEVFLYGDPEKLPPDALTNYVRWLDLGEVKELTERAFRFDSLPADLYVDAIFGTGLTRAPEGDLASLLRHLGGSGGDHDYYHPRLVAIDAPSGLCLDSGRMLGGGEALPFVASVPLVRLCVTFDSPKTGHFIADGPACCGRLVVKDIGLRKWRETRPFHHIRATRFPDALLLGPELLVEDNRHFVEMGFMLPEKQRGHKYSYGHALILGGGPGKGGAARLAARGALRVGAGLVTLGAAQGALAENAARLDAIMLREIAGSAELEDVLADRRINAICIGPGLGVDRAGELLKTALTARPRTKRDYGPGGIVIDADGLTALAGNPALFAQLHSGCVLTPHSGEFARLFPDIAARLDAPPTGGPAFSRVDAAREAAARAGCTVLLKGPDTVIADPNGLCTISAAVYDRAAPWLATAGSGDVLAGFITGLLAAGSTPLIAAGTAAWLHVEAARAFGPGLIAEDLPEMLPQVFRSMGL